MNRKLNTATAICILAGRVAHCTGNSTDWESIAVQLAKLQVVAASQCRYVTGCIAHARTIADTLADTAENRGNIYADMTMLQLFFDGHL